MPGPTADHVPRNRQAWTSYAPEFAERAPRNWSRPEPTWGEFDVPDSTLHALPEDLEGKDVVELGCGTAYFSAWLARRGARPVGLDLTEAQLATARGMQERFGLRFPLVQADAENVPLRDASFDIAISEYGASIWCDPDRWIPEASRILRPGGQLIFLVNGTLLVLCEHELESEGAAGERFLRPYFGMHRFEWPDDPGIDFHIGYGKWIRLLRRNGFEVEDLIEVRPPEGAVSPFWLVTAEWARRWPSEEIWRVRKVG
jgi:SAM-dependent methyltransferase